MFSFNSGFNYSFFFLMEPLKKKTNVLFEVSCILEKKQNVETLSLINWLSTAKFPPCGRFSRKNMLLYLKYWTVWHRLAYWKLIFGLFIFLRRFCINSTWSDAANEKTKKRKVLCHVKIICQYSTVTLIHFYVSLLCVDWTVSLQTLFRVVWCWDILWSDLMTLPL